MSNTYTYIGKDGKPVLARDLEDERDALKAENERLREALNTPFMEMFLDGRNEHGTHVLPMPLGNIDDPLFAASLEEISEQIMTEAEALGYSEGDFVWVEFYHVKEERDGYGNLESGAYWEFSRINKPMTDFLARKRWEGGDA